MATEAMRELEFQLQTRTGCRKEFGAAECPHCEVIRERLHGREPKSVLLVLWDAVIPWVLVAVVFLALVGAVYEIPRVLARVGLWLSQ